jgi:hypothetical protein
LVVQADDLCFQCTTLPAAKIAGGVTTHRAHARSFGALFPTRGDDEILHGALSF